MLTDHQRIARQKADPSLVRLHRSLGRLRSTLTVMNTGAHPDDEQSGLMAYLSFGLGMRVVIACSTRGEGGQNALGPERGGALGVMRTREMEEAARELDADVAWLGHGPDDPVHDFGFSKNGDATMARWGERRIVERLVRAYRAERPDIVIPTFLDVPGQHGHHRAMTRAAEIAVAVAADPEAFPEHLEEGLEPWRVSKFYLPAWSGGGGTYDDEVPPPDATLTVAAELRDPATGAAYDQIGEWSRRFHASQGMGKWKTTPKTRWPLHLLVGPHGRVREDALHDDLPASFAELADCALFPASAGESLRAAQTAIDAATGAFPSSDAIVAALTAAARHLEEACTASPPEALARHGHRFERALASIDRALIEASGFQADLTLAPPAVRIGESARLDFRLIDCGSATIVTTEPCLPAGVSASSRTDDGVGSAAFDISVGAEAEITLQYPPRFRSSGGNSPIGLDLMLDIGGRRVNVTLDPDPVARIEPAATVEIAPRTILARIQDDRRSWTFSVASAGDAGPIDFRVPEGWSVRDKGDETVLDAPAGMAPGLHRIEPAIRDGAAGLRRTPVSYPHIGENAHFAPETLDVLVVDLELPAGARIGYVGGGADRVGRWLERMGLDVTELSPDDLSADLSRFTTVVVGIFAFGTRPCLREAAPRLHRFVEQGGHLVTLYHRPSDGWDPDAIPLRHLKIGSPSVRWRVTDPSASIKTLQPDHILMTSPNRIAEADWAGWDKERGLYFASCWDEAYEPLLAMNDKGETPLKGALVSAAIGKGRHTHVSLVLHHQMDRLVPGAFRLMANLVQPA